MNPALSISGAESESWLECPDCGTLSNTFVPLRFQAEFLKRPERYKMNAGGFGCQIRGELVMMADGSEQRVEYVKVGDKLMGANGKPVEVTELYNGYDEVYEVRVLDKCLYFNSTHMLYLDVSGARVTLPIRKYKYIPNAKWVTTHGLYDFKVRKTKAWALYYGFTVKGSLYIEPTTYSIIHNSGKTRTDIEDMIKHVLLIPNARVCVVARTYPALEATFVKDFYAIFPAKLVKSKNDQKHELRLTNGSEILFRSFDDPTKLKSMNLTKAIIVEASDCPESGFNMLQSRIRNTNAMLPEYKDGQPVMHYVNGVLKVKYLHDARSINLETNPSSNWVKNFLLDSYTVRFYGNASPSGYTFPDVRDPDKYTQVVPTSANPHLPATYIEEQSRGKSRAYIEQMINGSFNFSDTLVYPAIGTCIVPKRELPPEKYADGRRRLHYIIALDYGIVDPTHILYIAVDAEDKKIYVFDELRIHDASVKEIAEEHRKRIKQNGLNLDGLLFMPKFDGKSLNKRESDLKTIGSMFAEEGLFFEPAMAYHSARIVKINEYIRLNQLVIFSNCEFLIHELLNYAWKLDKYGNPTNQPEDGKDHGISALEFACIDLPNNIQDIDFNAYLNGKEIKHDKLVEKYEEKVYNPFDEDKPESTYFWTEDL